jgi:hypothetical protein
MTNVSTKKHVKHTNAVNQDESIFQMFDAGIDDEVIAQSWNLAIGYIKNGYKSKWRKARGKARKSPVRGAIRNIVKTEKEIVKIEHKLFDLEKLEKMKGNSRTLFVVIGGENGQKYPVNSITTNEVEIWDTGKDELFVLTKISAKEFQEGEYYFSKKQ